jgi:hypothetical protein
LVAAAVQFGSDCGELLPRSRQVATISSAISAEEGRLAASSNDSFLTSAQHARGSV